MGKKTTTLFAAMSFSLAFIASSMGGCDGAAEKRIDCIGICNEAEDCVGGDFDKSECKEQCNEDAEQDDVDRCEDCLKDQDSCSEQLKCTAECAGVLADIVFK
jgi:hypothetical protein